MRIIFIILLSMFGVTTIWSTHNRAGEITYVQIDELTIRMTVATYTKTSSAAADRDSLEIFWGDGSSQFVLRSNGNGDPLPNDVKVNFYIAEHTYPGRAMYTIYFTDPNRVSNILNVNPPNSIDIPFFLSTTFTLLDPQFQGFNNSAILLQPPLDFACLGEDFIHNPNAYDADGDSLAYSLITPFQNINEEVPNYINPDQVGAGPDNQISLDPLTGTFTWATPRIAGEYNVAFRIDEYRQGVLINSMIRDMQVLVRGCENDPPVIDLQEEYCVVAGDLLVIDINVTDPNQGQLVQIGATGGPFTFTNSAVLNAPTGYVSAPLKTNLEWQTECEHISNQYYQIVIRAVDNYFGDSTGLATLKTIRVKVVGPKPENITGESDQGKLRIEWDLPYHCEDAPDDYFQGFSVWRKQQSQNITLDTCAPGLNGYGYEKIVFVTNENNGDSYYYEDADVEPQQIYCYRILGEFAKSTITGNPFNRVESLVSDEVCLILKRDIPFITEVSVLNTDDIDGSVKVSWTRPVPNDLDTILNPGPYTYQLQQETSGVFSDIQGARFSSMFFASPIDTSFIVTEINTSSSPQNYQVDFYTNGNLNAVYGSSQDASTVFLTTIPSDRKVILHWEEEVPWNNYAYHIFKQNRSGTFDSIASSITPSFVDVDLENEEEYCYIVRSIGTYGITNIISPLINNSQVSCTVPFDSVPPCPPFLSVTNLCEQLKDDPENPIFGNTISWEEDMSCEEESINFRIYYSESKDGPYTLIEESTSSTINEFFHSRESSISGCYAVTTLDSLSNESDFSDIVCVENCPGYILPNTFTPNTDGSNDLFVPRVNRFIESIEMSIFNQWGNKVFETTDPQIRWDGTNLNGADLKEGVYYYRCKVFEKRVDESLVLVDLLKGHINLLR